MKKLIILLLASIAWLPSGPASAEILVVASKGVELPGITLEDVRQLFSGTKRSLAGVDLQPVDLPTNNPAREAFYQQVLNKNASQMRSYWARMTFTGKGNPPRAVDNVGELRALLLPQNSRYIGYIDRKDVSEEMTVLFALN